MAPIVCEAAIVQARQLEVAEELSKKNAMGEAPLRGVELRLRESAQPGRGWPPVLESSPSTGNCMRSGKDHRIVGGTR